MSVRTVDPITQEIVGNAQQFGLGRVRIGHEPALDDIGRARDLRE